MLENFEVPVRISRELTDEEIRRIERDSTNLLGGNNRGYVELRKIPERTGGYVFILRMA